MFISCCSRGKTSIVILSFSLIREDNRPKSSSKSVGGGGIFLDVVEVFWLGSSIFS